MTLVSAFCLRDAAAQLPATQLTSLSPPGAKAGATVTLQVAGANLDALRELQFSHPGIQATRVMKEGTASEDCQPVPGKFQVSVGADVAPGHYEARVAGRFGVSNPRVFVVGTLDEQATSGNNHSLETAVPCAINQTINGVVEKESREFFKMSLEAGQRLFLDCAAQRIDSRLNGALVLFDARGRELARANDVLGSDPLIDFTAPAKGDYFVALSDFLFRGGSDYFYRLTLHERAHLDFVFPPAIQAESEAQVALFGRNLPNGGLTDITLHGQALEKSVVTVRAPARDGAAGLAGKATFAPPAAALLDRFSHSVSPDVSTTLYIAEVPVHVEQEPNDNPEQAQTIEAPCEIAGQFYPARDLDSFQFKAAKGEVFYVDVLAHRLGQQVDPYLLIEKVVTSDQGETKLKKIASVDDARNRNERIGSDFDTSTDDPTFRLVADEDATYRVSVWDQFGGSRADPRRVYRLVIRHPASDFRLAAVPLAIQTPVEPNAIGLGAPGLRQGGATIIRVDIDRRDGFDGEIELSAHGLPEGVSCRGASIPAAASTANLVFEASLMAPPWAGTITIEGAATVAGERVVRIAQGGSVVWGTGNRQQDLPSFRPTGNVGFAVLAEPAVASIDVGPAQVWESARGGTIELPLKITRRRDFAGDLKLVCHGLPKELNQEDVTVKGDASEATLAVALTNTKAKPGLYSFFLRADARTKLVRDATAVADAQKKSDQLAARIAELESAVSSKPAGAGAEAAAPETVNSGSVSAELQNAQQAKEKADQALEAIKKANAPKDLNFAVFSPPIRLRVVDSPVLTTGLPAQSTVQIGSQVSQEIDITRRFGFVGKVEVAAEFPRGVAGLSCDTLSLKEGMTAGTLEIAATTDAKPGVHQVKIHLRGKFNKIEFDKVQMIELTVARKPSNETPEGDCD